MATQKNTICGMCGNACGMEVSLDNDRITEVRGFPDHIASKGGLCPKGAASVEYEYDSKRITSPLLQKGERGSDNWKEISWDRALKVIADRLLDAKDNHGAKSIVWHRGAAPRWGSNWSYVQRLMNVLGSPNYGSHDHLCYTPRVIAHKATYGGMPVPDYENTSLMILWGINPMASSLPNQGRRVINALDRGAELVVIDPRYSSTASKADLFLQPRPGTDGALALGITNHIIDQGLHQEDFVERYTHGFEEFKSLIADYDLGKVSDITGVPMEKIREVAELYSSSSPGAALEDGNGLEQHTNVVQTTRALASLRAITGNLGAPGGNIFPPPLNLKNIAETDETPDASVRQEKSLSKHPLYYPLWGVSSPEILDAIETGEPYKPRAMIAQGSSLATIASNTKHVRETINQLDFLATHDLYMTATAELSDVVLPAASFFEYPHIVDGTESVPSVDTRMICLAPRIVEPRGDCWSDAKVIFNIAESLGLKDEFPWDNEIDALNDELAPLSITVEELRNHPEGFSLKYSDHDLYRQYEEDGFDTKTGKIELLSEEFIEYGYNGVPEYKEPAESPRSSPELAEEYPLVCGTGLQLREFTHTQFHTIPSINDIYPDPFAEIHPNTAEPRGISEGDWIAIESPRGKIQVRALLTEKIPAETVIVAHGWGQPYTEVEGDPDNILTDDSSRCPISAATGNKSFLCKIYKEDHYE